MTKIETYIVDAFTDAVFKGNPAGVCLMHEKLGDDQMLAIAKELGLSETTFVMPSPGSHTYSIRYFSPKMEIPLCGHATLAASRVLFDKYEQTNTIHFITTQNLELIIQKEEEYIAMEFPVYDTEPEAVPRELLAALGVQQVNNSVYNSELKILLLEIDGCPLLRNLTPDYERLIKSHHSINGVVVTAISDQPNYDFESRYFWPWSGTNEDPVTGGTHTFLTKYWGHRLDKKKMKSFQCSERSGFMEVELISDHQMIIRSKAHVVLKGELTI